VEARPRKAQVAADRRPAPLLLGRVRGGARGHRAFRGTLGARGRPLGGRRVRAECEDPPQPSPHQENEDRGLDSKPEAGMTRVPYHPAKSQTRIDEAPMKQGRSGAPFARGRDVELPSPALHTSWCPQELGALRKEEDIGAFRLSEMTKQGFLGKVRRPNSVQDRRRSTPTRRRYPSESRWPRREGRGRTGPVRPPSSRSATPLRQRRC